MKELLLAWREPKSREWIVVGKLWFKDNRYYFGYTRGVNKALNSDNLILFGSMQDINQLYVSDEIFPIFKNRLFQKNRPEYRDYLDWLGFDNSKEILPLDELARTNGIRATDSLQLFEIPKPQDGKYIVYFYSHGLRHLPKCYQDRLKHLKEKERLFILKDIQNRVDKDALMLRTDDPSELVGYCPRFYAKDFNKLIELNGEDKVVVSIEKINLNAPLQLQLLCKLETVWSEAFEAFADDEYRLIIKEEI